LTTTVTTIYDKTWEALAWVQCSGAEVKQTVFDASDLSGATTGSLLDVVELEWNSAAVATSIELFADAGTDDSLIKVYGTGKIENSTFKLVNPNSSGATGDILVSTSAACNFLIRVVKSAGYGDGIQAYN